MRLALIGASGHWQEYAPALREVDDMRVVAVAPGEDGEPLSRFDAAAGVGPDTVRYADYRALLDAGGVDAVQVCVRPHRTAALLTACLSAGLPVMADKPLAMTEPDLADLWRVQHETGVFLSATHMYRRMRNFALAAEMVRSGQAGDIIGGHCQISFRWGASRPEWYRSRETYPGTFSFIGIHAVDTLFRMVGDRFQSASGYQSTAPHPDYPACASLCYGTVILDNGGVVVLSADFMRPMGAAQHGDVRLRLVGTKATLDATDKDDAVLAVVDGTRDTVLAAPAIPHWYTTFVRHVMGQGQPDMTADEALRITEVTLRIQRALDTGDTLDLRSRLHA